MVFYDTIEHLAMNKRNMIFQEKRSLETFIQLEELSLMDKMIKEKLKTHAQQPLIGIHKEIMQLVKMDNEDRLHKDNILNPT